MEFHLCDFWCVIYHYHYYYYNYYYYLYYYYNYYYYYHCICYHDYYYIHDYICSFCPDPRRARTRWSRRRGTPPPAPPFLALALLVQCCLSTTASFVLYVFRRVTEHRNLPHYWPMLKKTCARQVVLDKWVPPTSAVRVVDAGVQAAVGLSRLGGTRCAELGGGWST